MKTQFPPFPYEGGKVATVSPSGKIDNMFLRGVRAQLASWGLIPEMRKHVRSPWGCHAGTIRQCASDFQTVMDGKEIRAILCSRGGHGAVHLIERLDFTRLREHPKWMIGFSNITVLHGLSQYNRFTSLHAPMARYLAVEAADDPCSLYLRDIPFGKLSAHKCKHHKLNRLGTVKDILCGGSMAVFHGLWGTPYDIPPEGTILFIEDVGECPYAIERMMYNLKLGGVLEKLSGLVIGQFTEYEEDRAIKKNLYGALFDLVEEYNYPICLDFPVGHVTENLPPINGAEAELISGKKGVELLINPPIWPTPL